MATFEQRDGNYLRDMKRHQV